MDGSQVVSRWHDEDGVSVYEKKDWAYTAKKAQRDMDGVKECDCLIVFTGDDLSHGGRHSEFGMALALGKMTVIIGPRESVFHSLCPLVFDDVAGFLYDATDLVGG